LPQIDATKPVGPVDGSIGGHTRHCLDHVGALLEAVESGVLDYDNRRRDSRLEADRTFALRSIRELIEQVCDLPEHAMDQEVTLTTLLAAEDQPVSVRTSVGRELAYVLSHTVHHHALISAMVKTLGGWLPKHFGYAPSTIAYQKNQACAR
jgi:uncharacterized damage-inducible protein DinB